jgi:hypothetical protein
VGSNASIHFLENEYHCLGNYFVDVIQAPQVGVNTYLTVTIIRHPIDRSREI